MPLVNLPFETVKINNNISNIWIKKFMRIEKIIIDMIDL